MRPATSSTDVVNVTDVTIMANDDAELRALQDENAKLRRQLEQALDEVKQLRARISDDQLIDAALVRRSSDAAIDRTTHFVAQHIRCNARLYTRCRRWMRSFVMLDPRTELAHFFFPGDHDGPLGYLAMRDGQGEAISSRAMGRALHSMLQSATVATLDTEHVLKLLARGGDEGFYFGSDAHLAMFPTSYFSVFRYFRYF